MFVYGVGGAGGFVDLDLDLIAVEFYAEVVDGFFDEFGGFVGVVVPVGGFDAEPGGGDGAAVFGDGVEWGDVDGSANDGVADGNGAGGLFGFTDGQGFEVFEEGGADVGRGSFEGYFVAVHGFAVYAGGFLFGFYGLAEG